MHILKHLKNTECTTMETKTHTHYLHQLDWTDIYIDMRFGSSEVTILLIAFGSLVTRRNPIPCCPSDDSATAQNTQHSHHNNTHKTGDITQSWICSEVIPISVLNAPVWLPHNLNWNIKACCLFSIQ